MSAADTATSIAEQFEQSLQRTLSPEAVIAQSALMGVISFATVILFSLLRPRNKVIYEPKVKYHVGNKEPPRISNGVFGWVSPLIHTKEPELVDKIGLDAVTFLRFLRLMRWLFTVVAIGGAAMTIPVDVIYTLNHKNSHNALTMLTIRDVWGEKSLYAHIAASYVYTAVVLFFTWKHWSAMANLRRAWYRSPEYVDSFYARTLMITHVPKKLQSDGGVKQIFDDLKMPYPTTAVHIGRKVGQLPELIEQHNDTVRELEKYLVRYLKGGKIGKKRPMIRIGGFLGMGGQKVDAIDYYSQKLQKSEAKVEAYRDQIDKRKAENYGFASMAAVPYAHMAGKLLTGKRPKGAQIALAPNPKDIIWSNLTLSSGEVRRKKISGFFWLSLVAALNTVPLAFVSFLANISSLANSIDFLADAQSQHQTLFQIVSGILPPAVSALFGWLLPRIMRGLSKYQGAQTHSRLDRAVLARYFAFLVISQLIIFTLIGVVYQLVNAVIKEVNKHKSFEQILVDLKNQNVLWLVYQAYINQSSYWLTFFPLRGFLAVFDLAQIISLAWVSFKTHVFGRTPRDIREWTQPPEFEYAIYYANLLFMACVALVFAPLAPIVAAAAAIVFWISSWVYKYQLMFVFVSKVETGGRMWNAVINRLLFSVVLMQLLLLLTIGNVMGWKSYRWAATIPPIFIVAGFKVYLNRFLAVFRFYEPTPEELSQAKVHSERADIKGNRLSRRFGHPALHSELFTPMLHAKMMPLLSAVFSGKIGTAQAQMNEMGGQKLEASVVAGGVKIAGVGENSLAYDVSMYQRDRGETDWDARSMATTAVLGDGASIMEPSKSNFYANGRGSPAPQLPSGYDRYLSQGPTGLKEEIELTRFDTGATGPYQDHQPLLAHTQSLGYADPAGGQLPTYPAMSQSNVNLGGDAYREAPLHRPLLDRGVSNWSNASSGYSPDPQNENMAGRGAFKR